MKILRLTKNKLFLENETVIDISPDIIYEYKLKQGMDISSIYDNILYASIRQKAFFYISLKDRTRYELKCKLRSKYTNIEMIESVVEYLCENRYIDDVDYAISYILTHRNSKQKNIVKLMQKGVSKSDIDLAYEDISEEIENENLELEIEKMLNKNIEKANIIIKLMRKGYNYYSIKESLNNLERDK